MTYIAIDVRHEFDMPRPAAGLQAIFVALRDALRQIREDRIRRLAFLNLTTLDDGLLDDIGVTRAEVLEAARLAGEAASRRTRMRR